MVGGNEARVNTLAIAKAFGFCNSLEEEVLEGRHVHGLGEKRKRAFVLSLDFGFVFRSRSKIGGMENATLKGARGDSSDFHIVKELTKEAAPRVGGSL